MTELTYHSVEESLSKECLHSLPEDASQLYSWLWRLMNRKGRTNLWVSDRAASIGAQVAFEDIPRAKVALEAAGLFVIRPGRWPADDPPNICHLFKFQPAKPMTSSLFESMTCVSGCPSHS